MALTIYIDGTELVTILCTPTKLNCLVLGFLYSEGIISGMSDVASMRVCEEDSLADVKLSKPGYTPPARRTLASGCGGGVSFATEMQKVESQLTVKPEEVFSLMKQLNEKAELYRFSGGVHTSALCNNSNVLVVAEDIGRHNTLDKIVGECLLTKLPTDDKLLAYHRPHLFGNAIEGSKDENPNHCFPQFTHRPFDFTGPETGHHADWLRARQPLIRLLPRREIAAATEVDKNSKCT